MALGQPSITTPNSSNLRVLQTAISNIRQRLEAIEGALTVATNVIDSAASTNNTQLNVIRQQIAILQAEVASLGGLVGQGPGIEVWNGSKTITRSLEAGTLNVTIDNADGVAGNPTISVAASAADSIQYDNEGRAGIASDGGAHILAGA